MLPGTEKQFYRRLYSFGLNKPLGLGFAGEGGPYIKYPGDEIWWGTSLAGFPLAMRLS
jgi:cell division protein FtsI (penicillin-binding protein 3)